jgi:hypothetical protein
LDVFSEFGKDGLEWGFEGQAFSRREIGGDDDFLDFAVGGIKPETGDVEAD